ncbi:BspA family leucine-rich repeat surface protein, partial [Senegalimassilia anaerobia]|uniref:BspA family leucine-rich repeat surface protein n=1 Tax=Senegalimassilia anaerobia TaxID=1473216 RepID=UPI003A96AFBA
METTRNTLKAAMAALSAMAVALVAVILVSVHPVFASAAEEPVQGVAEGNISLSVPATTLPCALTADGTVITPDADKYAFVNTGSVAVSIASPEVKLSNGVHDVNMSAKAAVVATTDKNQFKKLFNESDKQIDWILNNQGQGEQTLMQGQSLCVKFGIDPLTYDKNANVIEQAATSSGCNIASVNYAYREKRMPAYAVFFDNGRTAKLYKGYDRPVKGQPYRGSTEPVFDFVDDIENDKVEVFVPYKDVLERVSVETEDGEIQPTTTKDWFRGCSKLASVEGLSKLDTSKVTDMSSMFDGCSGLASLDVSGWNTGNVTDMELMFSGCRGLASLDVSGLDTSNVTAMSSMFFNCSGLTSLDVPKFNTGNVTEMNLMFYGCSGLTSLDLSGLNTGNVTDMMQMFSLCSGLTSLDLSGFDTSKVTRTHLMFNGCSGLEQVTLREGWNFSFHDCDLPETMYVKDGNGSFTKYTGGFPTTKTDTYYTENGIKQAFAVVYDDGNGGRAAKLYKRANVPAVGDTFEDDAVTEVITGIENMP